MRCGGEEKELPAVKASKHRSVQVCQAPAFYHTWTAVLFDLSDVSGRAGSDTSWSSFVQFDQPVQLDLGPKQTQDSKTTGESG